MKICGIYKITSPTKKIYVGKSIDIFKRWRSYNNLRCKNQAYLYNSLKKHGADSHSFEVVCQCDRSELDNLEKYYIALFQCFNSEYGLNLREGGEGGGTCSDKTKKKISAAAIKNGNKPPLASFSGYTHTEEAKQIMSAKKKGKTSSFKGKKHTEESNQKNRENHLGKPTWNKGKTINYIPAGGFKKGHIPFNKGIKMSEEQTINSGRKKGSIPWNKGIKKVIKAV